MTMILNRLVALVFTISFLTGVSGLRNIPQQLKELIEKRKSSGSMTDEAIIDTFRRISKQLITDYPPNAHEIPDQLTTEWPLIKFKTHSAEIAEFFRNNFARINDRSYVAKKDNLKEILHEVNTFAVKVDKDAVAEVLPKLKTMIAEKISKYCTLNASEQQMYYHIYYAYLLSDTKLLIMKQFHNLFNFNSDLVAHYYREIDDHAEFVKKLWQRTKPYVMETKNTFWTCDSNTTYAEVKNFLQGYTQNEIDLDKKGQCDKNCVYKLTKSYSCRDNPWCNRSRRCKGIIRDCKVLQTPTYICEDDKTSYRRYLNVSNSKINRCNNREKNEYVLEGDWNGCKYCFCLCDESNKAAGQKYFNMRASLANVNQNKVVTGLRFVVKNDIVHLQAQDGKLLPNGRIDNNTVSWVPLEEYAVTDDDRHENEDFIRLKYERRSLNLDEIIYSSNYVVTGVRFKNLNSHIALEVKYCKFNFESGKLFNPFYNSAWKDNNSQNRKEIITAHKQVPTKCVNNIIYQTRNDTYIRFDVSSKNYDSSQTIVPFMDGQDVALEYPTPLSGVGLIYKNGRKCAGFIKPKLFTYNYSHYVNSFQEI